MSAKILSKRRIFLWTLILLTLTLFLTNRFSTFFYDQFRELTKIPVPTAKRYEIDPKKISPIKTILYWDTFHGVEDFYFGYGTDIFKGCPVSACSTTSNKSMIPVEEFDAIIFHGARYSIFKDYVPKFRSLHQKYIFLSQESPYNSHFDPSTKKNFYNWTMTYRRDSDIHYPYAIVQQVSTNYTLPVFEKIASKTKMAAWFVSNCENKRRLKYAKALQKYMDVDIYGKCGDKICPRGEKCMEMLEKDFFFYLSFENSLCPDYVTEKLFDVLKYNVVPVVMGSADYGTIAPPKSVINVNDFDDPSDLADYLIQLSSNYEGYIQYFEWKKHYEISPSREYALCQLCELLHSPVEYCSYADIEEWFYGYKCVA